MKSCWGITTGQAGMVSQVQALSQALHLSLQMKKVTINPAFAWLPNMVFASPLRTLVPRMLTPESDSLTPPYPDIVISCGRRGALVAMGLKTRAPDSRFIHIQDPQVKPRYFDLVVAMAHDKVKGPNVIKTRFALHSITPAALEQARQKFETVYARFPTPRVAVLLGGSTNKYLLGKRAMQELIETLKRFQMHTRASLLITPSRRTGEENTKMLRDAFEGDKKVSIYDFESENPYMGLLALSDSIVVTNDSVNMMSEAFATGKPVYILTLPRHHNTKPARFADKLIEEGLARELGNSLDQWSYPLTHEMNAVAQEIQEKLWGS